tara:strand:+ start:557 stop:1711 length:1155 start_codon:yes stop_codon:yes gene_type:complete
MKICLVSSSFYPATSYGGPIYATWDLSRNIIQKDVKVYVSTTNANGGGRLHVNTNRFIEKEKNLFIKYYHEQLINRFSFQFVLGVFSDIKQSDVVYIQYLFHYTVLISLFFSFLQNKKVMLCPRGSLSLYGLNYKRKWVKRLWLSLLIKPFLRNVIWHASSFLEENDIKRTFPHAKILIIPDGVDFKSFQRFKLYDKRGLLKRYTNIDFQDVSNIFFSMGRLHVIKGFDVLIDAFSMFLKDDKNAKLIIAGGDDGVEKKLRQQILDLELQSSVFLIGAVDFEDKNILLNNCDYFTLASEFESFGIVVAEALSCGKPIILSNKTSWENLEKNKCGILVDNNKISLYNAFLKIVQIKYDGKEIKNYVKSHFDWSLISEIFLNNIKK